MDKNDVQESNPQQNSQNRVGIGMHVLISCARGGPSTRPGGMLMPGPPGYCLMREAVAADTSRSLLNRSYHQQGLPMFDFRIYFPNANGRR